MKFNLENLNPGVFFPFEDDDDEGGITIRLANSDVMRDIDKKTVKKKVQFRRGQRFEVDDTDEEKRSDMIWEYVIVDWKGVFDESGEEIPCTTENKLKLMRESVQFANFVANAIEQLTESTAGYEEELEKN